MRRGPGFSKPTAVWLDRAEQVRALLDAAGELDREARQDRRHIARRAMIAVFAFAGLRISEVVGLRWRDVDLAAGRLWVHDSKTDAGRRYVELLPALRDELARHKANTANIDPDAFVFPTRTGRRFGKDNVRKRIFTAVVDRANERLTEAGRTPLPEGLSPHKLRHTYCSLLFAQGLDLPRIMGQLGHADSGVTLRIYAHVMNHGAGEREALRALVNGGIVAPNGTSAAKAAVQEVG
jgi:integrase